MFKRFSNIQFSAIALILFVVLVIAAMILLYYYHVGSYHSFAKDSEPWGQFGDFFGGILNPIISLVNMYLLYRIFRYESANSERVSSMESRRHLDSQRHARETLSQEKARHKEILKNSIIPWGDFHLSLADMIEIRFKNHGNGLLIIEEIIYERDGERLSTPLKKLVPPIAFDTTRKQEFVLPEKDSSTLSKDEEIVLFRLTSSRFNEDREVKSHFDTWLYELSRLEIKVKYTDIYRNEFVKSCTLKQWSDIEAGFLRRTV